MATKAKKQKRKAKKEKDSKKQSKANVASPELLIYTNGNNPHTDGLIVAQAAEKAPPKFENPECIEIDGHQERVEDLLAELHRLRAVQADYNKISKKVRKYQEEKVLKPYQAELIQMQAHLEAQKKRMIVLFEGRDAAGKGGTIRRVTRYMNEKHYRVVALGAPSSVQRTQWYFQRYIEQFPRGGEIVLFDRSWYTRAMTEPIFGFCTEQEYKTFMHSVVGFEQNLVQEDTIFVKLYFSVTKAEQAYRFDRRKTDPLRQWKLSEVDLQSQDRWDEFTEKKYQMLKRTHTSETPWTVIRSDDKHQARLNAMKVILNAVPYEKVDTKLDLIPDPEIVVSGARELENLKADRLRNGKFVS